jgi:hypothetical protein
VIVPCTFVAAHYHCPCIVAWSWQTRAIVSLASPSYR